VKDLRDAIRVFIDQRDWEQFHSPKNLAMALSVEVAEVAEHFQWLTEEQSRNLPPEKLAEVREEIGDMPRLRHGGRNSRKPFQPPQPLLQAPSQACWVAKHLVFMTSGTPAPLYCSRKAPTPSSSRSFSGTPP
jgi:hypothetical protein